ncbi:hypothetical protein LCGC14_0232780 [marine sediment metagenome]|uniref:Uncharacterized protein n=1 Tax=marine sediment metagenome TaxID=412755 RepID=A0A0F9URL2_9ZZZZ
MANEHFNAEHPTFGEAFEISDDPDKEGTLFMDDCGAKYNISESGWYYWYRQDDNEPLQLPDGSIVAGPFDSHDAAMAASEENFPGEDAFKPVLH